MKCADHIDLLVRALKATATQAGTQLDDWGTEIYLEELASLPLSNVLAVLRTGFTSRKFPSVDDIVAEVTGRTTPQETAQEVADRIADAIGRIGYYRSEDARAAIGELGWEVVQQSGGWRNVCAIESDKDLKIAKAGWRETAKWVAQKAKAGKLDEKPALPKPSLERSGEQSASDVISNLLPFRPDASQRKQV